MRLKKRTRSSLTLAPEGKEASKADRFVWNLLVPRTHIPVLNVFFFFRKLQISVFLVLFLALLLVFVDLTDPDRVVGPVFFCLVVL